MSISKFEVMDMINDASDMAAAKEIAAHYMIALARGSRMAGEPLTELESALLCKAQGYLRWLGGNASKISEKTARVLAMPPEKMLTYVNRARKGGHEIPEILLKVEAEILSRGG
ncbi:MAG: hypothetical protein V3V40_06450 [Nitrosomonadaceae bacterium]